MNYVMFILAFFFGRFYQTVIMQKLPRLRVAKSASGPMLYPKKGKR